MKLWVAQGFGVGRIPVAQPHNSAIGPDGRTAYVASQRQGEAALVVRREVEPGSKEPGHLLRFQRQHFLMPVLAHATSHNRAALEVVVPDRLAVA